jgi:uncharacterized membrane protein
MIRKFLSATHDRGYITGSKRNNEIQRIETFSDGVFAFAVTLLIVSLEVPKSFEELVITMRSFFAFGISFLLLVMIWNEQHRFFRNYGMEDGWTLTLNGTLLFLVLFYVYPLKFLFSLIFGDQIYGTGRSPFTIRRSDVPHLMMIYSIGFIAIYSLFFLMNVHARRNHKKLRLTPVEIFDCTSNMYRLLIMILAGFGSLIVAMSLNDDSAGQAGYVFFVIGPAIWILFFFRNKIKRKLFPHTGTA